MSSGALLVKFSGGNSVRQSSLLALLTVGLVVMHAIQPAGSICAQKMPLRSGWQVIISRVRQSTATLHHGAQMAKAVNHSVPQLVQQPDYCVAL